MGHRTSSGVGQISAEGPDARGCCGVGHSQRRSKFSDWEAPQFTISRFALYAPVVFFLSLLLPLSSAQGELLLHPVWKPFDALWIDHDSEERPSRTTASYRRRTRVRPPVYPPSGPRPAQARRPGRRATPRTKPLVPLDRHVPQKRLRIDTQPNTEANKE